MANTVLKLNNFTVVYKTQKGPLEAVRNVSFELKEGETLAIVGESGCGKSSLARGILRLFPRNLEKATGEIYINGTEVLSLKEEEFRKNIRWSKISMVFQGAMNSHFNTQYHMPVLYFTQMIGLAFGMDAASLGIGTELVDARPALSKIGVEVPEAELVVKKPPKEALPMPSMPEEK